VARNVPTPVPNPVTPPTGNVQFVRVPLVGVPKTGVIKDGEVCKITFPVPLTSLLTDVELIDIGV
jgi:hypothetical protein